MNLDTVLQQMKECGAYDTWGTKKEVKALPEILSDDEIIQYATSGFVNGNTVLVVLTQKRILFIDKGMLYGIRSTEIPLDMVNSVSYSKGLILGTIAVMNGATKIEISNITKDTCPVLTEKIKDCVEQYKYNLYQQQSPQKTTTVSSEDTVAEIRKFKQLYDEGILTEEEFIAKKKIILGI
ncbi:TPA: PH domain-containing protein [Streptococcus agalactiae]|uniref:PH domain-containing protein n=1 Tax=Streptococcus agalactiae TaxID=1311 RepID=UPI0002BB6609|nr:PH domain-containing protein [Streptococcus agalactiae]ASA89463.1 hypothetical protein BB164_02500 [Streptococcus agalactiae]EPT57623.1 hypothetical protein SAG0053_10230 [Streptococcus agalactiae CCUG 25532]EPW98471.1 hypothetical protein SAG0147_02640 [Streptococcus agalactiae MRI Z1-048]MCH9601771.1 PH domain-containing protein [Streptococcus agalactiae]NHZ68983.1 hypothetical protein [Streptococcus agalactiae]